MVHINSQAQFDVFETIRSIILNNSILNKKFTKNNIFEYDPSKTQFVLPQIIIKSPQLGKDEETLGPKPTYSKNFEVELVMRVGYEAKDKVRTYMNSLNYAIENDITMSALGYYISEVSNNKPEPNTFFDVNAIEVNFTLDYKGDVSYG